LLTRVDLILDLLNQGTYYSILSPLSAAIRQAVSGVKEEQIDHSITPEVASLRSLKLLAADAQEILLEIEPERIFEQLEQIPEGRRILDDFAEILEDYGYLSEVGTDISVPRWKEQPHLVRQMFVQFIQGHEA
ncbi:MAG: pyruvate phosphate dikinase PEP/pyruvate-binding protein, partial [Sphaerospermopsis kisseleviana]